MALGLRSWIWADTFGFGIQEAREAWMGQCLCCPHCPWCCDPDTGSQEPVSLPSPLPPSGQSLSGRWARKRVLMSQGCSRCGWHPVSTWLLPRRQQGLGVTRPQSGCTSHLALLSCQETRAGKGRCARVWGGTFPWHLSQLSQVGPCPGLPLGSPDFTGPLTIPPGSQFTTLLTLQEGGPAAVTSGSGSSGSLLGSGG